MNIGACRSQSRTCIFLSCCQSYHLETASFTGPEAHLFPNLAHHWVSGILLSLSPSICSVVHVMLVLEAKRWKTERVWPLPPQLQKATEVQAEWGRAVFAWRSLEFVLWNWESEAWLPWRPQKVEDARAMRYLPRRELHAGSRISPGGLSFAAAKLGRQSHLSTLKPTSKTPNL